MKNVRKPPTYISPDGFIGAKTVYKDRRLARTAHRNREATGIKGEIFVHALGPVQLSRMIAATSWTAARKFRASLS
jgi:hypothetical protein